MEFKQFRFIDFDWSDNQDEYTRKLVCLTEKLAQVMTPGFSVSFVSGCGQDGHIKWKESERCIGYFEYYIQVKDVFFSGEGTQKINVTAECGFYYESDGTDEIGVSVHGLPAGFHLFLRTEMTKTVDVYVTALPTHLDFIKSEILNFDL